MISTNNASASDSIVSAHPDGESGSRHASLGNNNNNENNHNNHTESISNGGGNLFTFHLQVEGMMCQANCARTVRNALYQLSPLSSSSRSWEICAADAIFAERRAWVQVRFFCHSGHDTVTTITTDNHDDDDNKHNNHQSFSSVMEEFQTAMVDCIEEIGFDATPIHNLDEYLIENRHGGNDKRSTQGHPIPTFKTLANAGTEAPMLAKMMDTQRKDRLVNNNNNNNVTENRDDCHTQAPHMFVLQVRGMSCAVCTSRVERALRDVHPSITHVTVVLATSKAIIEWDDHHHEQSASHKQQQPKHHQDDVQIITTNLDRNLYYDDDDDSERKHTTATVSTTTDPHHDKSCLLQACISAVQRAGYECEPVMTNSVRDVEQFQRAQELELRQWSSLLVSCIVLMVPMMILDEEWFVLRANRAPTGNLIIVAMLATWMQFRNGHRYYRAAWYGWSQAGVLGMDFLITMGTTACYLYSFILFVIQLYSRHGTVLQPNFMTGGWLITFVSLGKFLESYAKGRTASAIQALMEIQPNQAWRILSKEPESGDEKWDIAALQVEEVDITAIRCGDFVRVMPAARIPTDGVLVACSTSTQIDDGNQAAYVDESALSGEPFPVPKTVGDRLYGSTVNQLQVLVMKVTATGGNTVLSKIVRLVEDAQRKKAPIQAYADRVASIFAPSVMVLATVTFLGWLVLNGNVSTQERFFTAFMSAISVVVVACPCALGLATPTAVMVGTGVGARQGILIKGGDVLEKMHAVGAIILDKTGTITTGRPTLGERVDYVATVARELPSFVQDAPVPIHEISLWLAACAESGSEHPVGKAIVHAAQQRWTEDVTFAKSGVQVNEFRLAPGCGVECRVSKPHWGDWWVRVGSQPWTQPDRDDSATATNGTEDFDYDVHRLRSAGSIAVYVSVAIAESNPKQWRVIAVIGIVDPIKDAAHPTVMALQNMGVEVWMCTGDHEETALVVASTVGIPPSQVRSGMSPEAKADLVSQLQTRCPPEGRGDLRTKRMVAMVGDGINDAIALARADVGMAIGAGTEVALEAADVVLVHSSLHDVVVALHLSIVVFRRIVLNFVWAMGYNLLALPFAAGMFYPFMEYRLPPELAGMMMALSSVSVVTSSLLLRRYKRPAVFKDRVLGGEGCLLRFFRRFSCCNCCKSFRYSGVSMDDSTFELV